LRRTVRDGITRALYVNRALDSGAILIRPAAGLEESAVDQLDINSAVSGRLDRVREFHQLSRGGIWISQAARFDELHAASMCATWTC
jgi:hypothetical protein